MCPEQRFFMASSLASHTCTLGVLSSNVCDANFLNQINKIIMAFTCFAFKRRSRKHIVAE